MGLRERFARFMQGRYGAYGPDRLNRALNFAAIALVIVSLFVHSAILNAVTLALIAFPLYRMLSRNHMARQRESEAYARIVNKAAPSVRGVAKSVRRRAKDAARRVRYFRTHRFYNCTGCGRRLRVPKVRGRLQISCPKCGATFIVGGRALSGGGKPKPKPKPKLKPKLTTTTKEKAKAMKGRE